MGDGVEGSMALLKVALYPSASVIALKRRGGGKEVNEPQHCVGSATVMMQQSATVMVQQSVTVMDIEIYTNTLSRHGRVLS